MYDLTVSQDNYNLTVDGDQDIAAEVDTSINVSIVSDLNDYAPVITDTASGAIASFSDGASDRPVVGLSVGIEPIQSGSGDPSPTNIRPITGHTQTVVTRTGVNVWDEEWELGSINSNTGENNSTSSQIRSKNFIPVKPGMQLYVKSPNQGSSSAGNLQGRYYDSSKQYLGYTPTMQIGNVFAVPENCYYIRFACQTNYGTTYNHDISINYPSTDTTYHASHVTNITIPFGSTVYGGTVDVVNGVLTVDRAINVIDGTQELTGNGIQAYGGIQVRYIPSPAKKLADTQSTQNSGLLSDKFSTSSAYTDSAYQLTGRATNAYVYFNMPTSVTLTAQASAWFTDNPTQLIYELAEPITIELTANQLTTLLGDNNVWADTGDTAVEYRADTKLYIDKMIASALGG